MGPCIEDLPQKCLVLLQQNVLNLFPGGTLGIECESDLHLLFVWDGRAKRQLFPLLEDSDSFRLKPVY